MKFQVSEISTTDGRSAYLCFVYILPFSSDFPLLPLPLPVDPRIFFVLFGDRLEIFQRATVHAITSASQPYLFFLFSVFHNFVFILECTDRPRVEIYKGRALMAENLGIWGQVTAWLECKRSTMTTTNKSMTLLFPTNDDKLNTTGGGVKCTTLQ